MSAVFGLLYRDGEAARPMEPWLLRKMAQALAHRGPDGQSIWQDGPAGLGHLLLHTTPESVRERQPLHDAGRDLVATADARLDNRAELLAILDLPASATDADLVLAAYARWGEASPSHLVGDFAFAVWDGGAQRLFCARDHVGVKPLVYASVGDVFAWASEAKALLTLPALTGERDEAQIADFLLGEPADPAATFYREIRRLPPAHTLTVDAAGLRLRRYWSPSDVPELHLGSDAAYAEAFRETFSAAVRCRLRTEQPAGALLSGGLDSSSIVCVASGIQAAPLPTFSCVYDAVPACDERPYQRLVLEAHRCTSATLPADDLSPLSHLDELTIQAEGPPFGPGLASQVALYRMASAAGVRTLLDGHGGDEVVSHGEGYLSELALAHRWPALLREVRGVARTYDEPSWPMFATYARFGLSTSSTFRKLWRAGGAVWHGVRGTMPQPPAEHPELGVVLPALAARVDLADRVRERQRAQARAARTERGLHLATLDDGRQPLALEVLDRIASAAGVDPRYPFWDKRLVELCVSVPAEQKLRGGWPRSILRRAMDGILPPAIQWRTDKTDFSPSLRRGLLTFERRRLDQALLEGSPELDAYVDRSALRRRYDRWLAAEQGDARGDIHHIWRAIALGRWLQLTDAARQQASPVRGVFSQGLPAAQLHLGA